MLEIYNNSKALQRKVLSSYQIDLVNQIEYEKKDQTWWIGKIVDYLNSGYPLEVLVQNQKEIRQLGRDSSSLRAYVIRYGEKLGTELYNAKTISSTVTRERMVNKLGDDGANEFYKKRGASLENFITRHGVELGAKLWEEYLEKRKSAYKEKRRQGHVFLKYNLEYYIKLYGEEKGASVYNQKINSQRYKVSKAYYIEQFGPVLGPIRCREAKDHCSESYFQKKYGVEQGSILYTAHCLDVTKRSAKNNRYSLISKEVFDAIKESVTDLHYYGENEMVWATSGPLMGAQRAICPDLFYRGKIIEFNGDLFHANPSRFTATDTPHPYNKSITAKEIWDNDNLRLEYYKSKKYKVLVIWESEYRQNPTETIKQCIQFLTN